MKKKGYKYTIHFRLQRLSVEDFHIAMNWLPSQLGVTRRTFRGWVYTKANDGYEIPGSAVLKMAEFFGVEPKDMFTYPPAETNIVKAWNDHRESVLLAKQKQIEYYDQL